MLENLKYFDIDGIEREEKWLPVLGYEGLYEVSDCGRLKSLSRTVRLNYRPRVIIERILKTANCHFGYPGAQLCKDCIHKKKKVHRLVAIAFLPNPFNLPEVNHKNGIKHDNFKNNLEWVTTSQNAIHAIKIGLAPRARGERASRSKLKEFQILEIRNLYLKGGVSQRELGRKYNVKGQTIAAILARQTWKHI